MKIFYTLIIAISVSLNAFSISYVSNASGAWSDPTIWTPNGTPTSLDNVTISVGHTVTNNVDAFCLDLTVNGTFTGQTFMRLLLRGNYVIAVGGTENGSGEIYFNTGAAATITNNGTIGTGTVYLFYKNMTIAAGNSISKTVVTNIQGGITVTNQSSVTLANVTVAAGSTWVNAAGSTLTLTKGGFLSSPATAVLVANADGNTVHYTYTDGAASIKTPSAGYYNLTISGVSPKILSSDLTVLNQVTINTGSQLAVNGFNLTVGGNFTKNGDFVTNAGKTVTFNGSAAQTIAGTGTTTFRGLTINNSAGVSITSGTYILDEVLTVSNGPFNTGGMSFTMTSTAAQTARIAPIAGTGSIVGSFIIERFISTRDSTWADLSSPVQSSTFLDWDNELPVISYNYNPTDEYPTQWTYSEPTDYFSPVTSSGTALTPGKGFEVYLAGDFSYANFPNTTINTIGVPNQLNQNLNALVSFSSAGTNLVGNPFASSISWSAVFAASSGLLSTYDMYDFASGNYATFGLGTEIGSGQGFWVYATAAPTLQVPETAKTTSSNSSIRSTIAEPFFTLKLSSNDENNNYYHTLKITADNHSSDGWDNNDHPFRKSPNQLAPSIFSFIDGKKSVINSFNLSNDSYSMPIQTNVGISGSYKIESAGFDNVSEYSCIKLEDKLLNKTVILSLQDSYSFQMNAGDNPNRFIVHFSKNDNCKSAIVNNPILISDIDNFVSILPTTEGNSIKFYFTESTPVNITFTNVIGQTVVDAISMNAESQTVNIALPQDFSGMYIVKIESSKGAAYKKFVRK